MWCMWRLEDNWQESVSASIMWIPRMVIPELRDNGISHSPLLKT